MDKENGNRKRSTKEKVATERVQMESSRGKKIKEKGKSYRGNNNRGEIGDTRKGRRRRMNGKNIHIGNKWWEITTIYST
jgi:hypothetical protein